MCMICISFDSMSVAQVVSNLFEVGDSIDKNHQRDILMRMSKRDGECRISGKSLKGLKKALKNADWKDSEQYDELIKWRKAQQ